MRPIVVFIPETEREALRNGGGLPESWFASFDDNGLLNVTNTSRPSIIFWPYELNYTIPDLTDPDKPLDVFSFLSEVDNSEQEEKSEQEVKHLHEREVFSAFCNTIAVHIAFIDAPESGDVSQYMHLNSFRELANWCQIFKKSLSERFNKRTNSDHVLVVIARGEQVKTSHEELSEFNSALKNAGLASCYILDHDLGQGESAKPFFASEVWIKMVERLLLHFVLAEENKSLNFNSSAITKIWQAYECRLSCKFADVYRSKDRLETVNEILQKDKNNDFCKLEFEDLSEMSYDNEKVRPNIEYEHLKFFGGWSCYPVEKLGEECEARHHYDSQKWDKVRKNSQNIYKYISKCYSKISIWIGDKVHSSPAVKAHEDELEQVIKSEIGRVKRIGFSDEANNKDEQTSCHKFLFSDFLLKIIDPMFHNKQNKGNENDNPCQNWSISYAFSKILREECKRQEALYSLLLRNNSKWCTNSTLCKETLAEAVKKAKDHYVGFFKGAFLVSFMSAMAGWVIWRATIILGSTPYFAMILSIAFAVGGFSMLIIMLILQRISGDLAINKLIDTAKKADEAYAEKDFEARKLILNARTQHCHLVRIGKINQVKKMLERIYEVMNKELNKGLTSREKEDNQKSEKEEKNFDYCTVKMFDEITLDFGFEENLTIDDEWKKWCKIDSVSIGEGQYHNGYLPASFFYSVVNNFIISFKKQCKRNALQDAIANHTSEDHSKGVYDQLKEWCKERHEKTSSEFASADTKDKSLWSQTEQRFYIPLDPDTDANDLKVENAWENGIKESFITDSNVGERYNVITSRFIDEARSFALFYREIPVSLECNEKNILSFGRIESNA